MGSVMAIVNGATALLADLPPMLGAAWLAWIAAAGVLVAWYRKARFQLEYAPPSPPPRPAPRSRSAVRPPSSVRRPAVQPVAAVGEPVEENGHGYEPPPALTPHTPRPRTQIAVGDPFGDLATLLDQPPQPNSAPLQAAHGSADSPILGSSGFPLNGRHDHERN